ncbi:MAG: cytochrome c biogenesis protein ResB [Gemmataceae bacterium]|nr:cytochrome c biogenesis protein ResB [Gemmataceae bacterium]
MSQAITPASSVRKADAPVATPAEQPKPQSALTWLRKRLLEPVASLRVTVVLFSLSLFLVFAGTLAQAEAGIWTVVNDYFRTGIAWIPFQVFVKFGQVFLGLDPNLKVAGSFPFPGGWLLGGLLLANLLAAHAVRFRLTWKRSGILLIHAGLIVMMLGELVTGLYAVEGNMTISQDDATNFVDHHRETELAVIDRSDPKIDSVFAIPESLVRKGQPIRDPRLPFEIAVDRYMVNSAVVRKSRAGDAPNPATAGDGLNYVAVEQREVSGASSEGADIPSAYVTLKHKDSGKVETYLLSTWFYPNFSRRQLPDRPQKVTGDDGKEYHLYLRLKRTYRPFSIYLLRFEHKRFQGTSTPKDFASEIRLVNASEGEDRRVRIWMNNPMRYQGETFYQSAFLAGDSGTILQVVRNPGWLMPYISCAIVSLGMLFHFGLHLVGFLRRRAAT